MHYDLTPSEIDRFWSKIDRNGPVPEHRPELGPCWIFTGRPTHGYGQLGVIRGGKGVCFRAHVISWVLHFGQVPDDLCVLHHCDTPLCCRPEHLFSGTRTDNARDKTQKGRSRNGAMSGVWKGERVTNSRFTQVQIQEIRDRCGAGESQRSVARSFGTYQGVISNIVTGRAWKHSLSPAS